MQRHFKDSWMQQVYDHYRSADIKADRGSSDRAVYWDGREGKGKKYPHLIPMKNTLAYARYVAGVDRQAEIDKERDR